MAIQLLDRFADRKRNRTAGLGGGPHLLDRVHAEPTPPPHWVRRLREFSPISDTVQWLNFRMFPVQQGIGRHDVWVLYTMTPASLITDQTKLKQLQDRPWWELPKDEQYGRMVTCSAYQWEMYRQFQCLARPYWCLQGVKGGTPMQYTPYEAALLRARGLPTDVPEPGTLAFAPFDERVMTAIAVRDRMRTLGDRFSRLADPVQAVKDVKAEDEAAEKTYRTEFVKWFEERMAPNGDYIAWHSNKSENVADFRPATKGEADAASRWQEHYIEFGTVPHASPDQ